MSFATKDRVCILERDDEYYLRDGTVTELDHRDCLVKIDGSENSKWYKKSDLKLLSTKPEASPQKQESLFHKITAPAHYKQGRKFEPIDVIEDWFGDGSPGSFHKGTAVAYIARSGRKENEPEIDDLEKAVWYLNRRIEQLRSLEKSTEE